MPPCPKKGALPPFEAPPLAPNTNEELGLTAPAPPPPKDAPPAPNIPTPLPEEGAAFPPKGPPGLGTLPPDCPKLKVVEVLPELPKPPNPPTGGGRLLSETSPEAYPMSIVEPGESIPYEVELGGVEDRIDDDASGAVITAAGFPKENFEAALLLLASELETGFAPKEKAGAVEVEDVVLAPPPKVKLGVAVVAGAPVAAGVAAAAPNLNGAGAALASEVVEGAPPNLKVLEAAGTAAALAVDGAVPPKVKGLGVAAAGVLLVLVLDSGALPKPPKEATEAAGVAPSLAFAKAPKPPNEGVAALAAGLSSFLTSGTLFDPKEKLAVVALLGVVVEATGAKDRGAEAAGVLLAEDRNPNWDVVLPAAGSDAAERSVLVEPKAAAAGVGFWSAVSGFFSSAGFDVEEVEVDAEPKLKAGAFAVVSTLGVLAAAAAGAVEPKLKEGFELGTAADPTAAGAVELGVVVLDEGPAAGVDPKVNFGAALAVPEEGLAVEPKPPKAAGVAGLGAAAVVAVLEAAAPPSGLSQATHLLAPLSLGTRQTSHFIVLRALAHRELPPAAGAVVVATGGAESAFSEKVEEEEVKEKAGAEEPAGAVTGLGAATTGGAASLKGPSQATHLVAPFSFGTRHAGHLMVLRALAHRELELTGAGADVSTLAAGDLDSNLAIGMGFTVTDEKAVEFAWPLFISVAGRRLAGGEKAKLMDDLRV